MTNEQAKFLADHFSATLREESKTTRRVIEAIPQDKGDYTPDPKSMTSLALAHHIASSEVWFLNSVATANFEWTGGSGVPEDIKTPADVIAWYDANFSSALEKVKAAPAEVLTRELSVFGPPTPNIIFLDFCIRHSIHHRGQLAAYLRPMGSKVPSIYGGSADEPYQASA